MKFLIQSGSGIGSLIKQTVFARAIREKYVDAVIDVIVAGSADTEKIANEILEHQQEINNVYWYNSRNLSHDLSVIRMLREQHYDIGFVTIENLLARKSSWIYLIMKLAGCKKIVGSGSDKLDVGIEISKRTHYFDRINRYLDAVGISAITEYNTICEDTFSYDWIKSYAIDNSRQIVSIILGSKKMASKKNGNGAIYDVKSWGLDKWIKLCEKLIHEGKTVFLIGGKSELEEMNELGISLPENDNTYDFVGKTTISQSLSLLSMSDLVIGGEGGMIHCAAAIGTNTITIFGGTDYKVFAPRGSKHSEIIYSDLPCYPCYGTEKAVQCMSHECLQQITIDSVFDKAKEMLTTA